AYDPSQGFIASSNNRPAVHTPALGYFFSANDRINRFRQLCQQKDKLSFEDVKKMQHDVVVLSALRVRDLLMRRLDQMEISSVSDNDQIHAKKRQEPQRSALLENLRQWDGAYLADSKGAVAFQTVLYHFIRHYFTALFDKEVSRMLLGSEHANEFVIRALENGDTTLVDRSIRVAIDQAANRYHGDRVWGDMHRLVLSHLLGRIPLIGSAYRYGDYPVRGSSTTLHKTAHAITTKRHATFYGANARFLSSLKDQDENYFVLLGGQDGFIGSKQCVDQIPLWLKDAYIRIPLRIENVAKTFPYAIQCTGTAVSQPVE
ncbi:MAG: penicillin acylase family protein, partial [Chitinivibrionales bacterium]|nr:penicillin acylase family protein [Chitinivibrionales bacterium]